MPLTFNPFSAIPGKIYGGVALAAASLAATTPGAVNPDVTQANIESTICVSGWTKTIRPPASYTTRLKKQQMAARHLSGSTSDYEEDHIISLELGGHPTDPDNLWPQPWAGTYGARKKDQLENRLKRMVCAHTITLAEAQSAIRTDWAAAYIKYIGALK